MAHRFSPWPGDWDPACCMAGPKIKIRKRRNRFSSFSWLWYAILLELYIKKIQPHGWNSWEGKRFFRYYKHFLLTSDPTSCLFAMWNLKPWQWTFFSLNLKLQCTLCRNLTAAPSPSKVVKWFGCFLSLLISFQTSCWLCLLFVSSEQSPLLGFHACCYLQLHGK